MITAYYLLKVILCSGLLLCYYWLALRNKAFHQWNRFYLLAITALSIVLPLLQFPFSFSDGHFNDAVRYISLASLDESVVMAVKQKPFFSLSTNQWTLLAYSLVALVLLLITIRATKGILKVLSSYPKQKLQQILFLNTDAPGAPFSFLNYMVWNKDIDLQSPTGKSIFQHELAHIQQKHTLDKIFMLLVLIPFWANPFFWLIRKELNDIHEFIADKQALQSDNLEDLSRMILNALYPKQAYLLTSPFFQASIKRRLKMFSIKNQKINYMSRILVLPILFMVAAAFTVKQQNQKENERFSKSVVETTNGDTIPLKTNTVIVEEIFKGSTTEKNEESIIVKELNSDNQNLKTIIIDTIPKSDKKFSPPILKKVDVEPRFNGNWVEFLKKNLDPKVPLNNGAPSGKYTVIAQFIVEMDGSITDLKTLTKHGYGMEEEVLKLMRQSPKWIPATQNGKKVRAYRKQPITFVITEDEGEDGNTNVEPTVKFDPPALTKVDEEAKFKGNWGLFLQKNLNAAVPVNKGAPTGTYTVIVQFIVDKDGKVHNPKAVTHKGFGMEDEVLRVMKLSTDWEPAKVNGQPVRAYRKQPITFVVSAK